MGNSNEDERKEKDDNGDKADSEVIELSSSDNETSKMNSVKIPTEQGKNNEG